MKTRKSKKLKGGISENNFYTFHELAQDISRKVVSMEEFRENIKSMNEGLKKYGPIEPLTLTDKDWCDLIAECYFRDNIYFEFDKTEQGIRLSKLFDYRNPDSFSKYQGNLVVDRGSLSVTRSNQGAEDSCFAHAATLMIFHNMYKLPLEPEEEKLYLKNNCNLNLDWREYIDNFKNIQYRCGEKGAKRILLFIYIYKVITNRFGCHGGDGQEAVQYYLKTPFQSIFPNLDYKIEPIYRSVDKKDFVLYNINILELVKTDWQTYLLDYFKHYYAVLYLEDPGHEVTLVGMNSMGILGKDSASGNHFTLPYEEFHPDGVFEIGGVKYTKLSYLICLKHK